MKDAMTKSEQLAKHVIQEAENRGVLEFCICPGARNSALMTELIKSAHLKKHYWFEERSAAFFALGRSRESKRPVAVITTSGSAAGELLPATMEAYYTGTPLLLITADRPRTYRGSGAPQAAEQVGILGVYAPFFHDLAEGETFSLQTWNMHSPAHLNVCFSDSVSAVNPSCENTIQKTLSLNLEQFLEHSRHPLVIVSALKAEAHPHVVDFLLSYKAPVFLEGVSGLREDVRLRHLRISRTDKIWTHAHKAEHLIDGVLRIGGVPTFRLWRDLEDKRGQIAVCSISETSFSGLSWGTAHCAPLNTYFSELSDTRIQKPISCTAVTWLAADSLHNQQLESLFHEEAEAEASLIHHLSKRIPVGSHVYLGNSLPIREWDLAACSEDRGLKVNASRGVNGIDGQISTFLGLSKTEIDNWAILGDLTTLYDMAGPWILSQMPDHSVNIVVINNSGGQIFSRMFPYKEFLNKHNLNFEPLAKMWGLHYERWTCVPEVIVPHKRRLIELVPDDCATNRFWKRLEMI